VLGVALTLFLLSLVGIPPLAGFWGKALIIISTVEAGDVFVLLAVIMMLNATAAAFYYLRVVVTMYMREAPEGAKAVHVGGWTRVGLLLAAIGVVAIGLLPAVTQEILDWTMEAARTLMAAV
jgi:NADH-quinone oxidoreductase subunit N